MRESVGIGLVALTLALGVSACGGGGDDENPAPTATTGATESVALTTANLISQGDAICAEVNAAIGAISLSTADETTKSSQTSDIYDGLAARLSDLGTPSDGQPPTDVIAAARELADGLGDTTTFQDAASEYGFTDCAEAPQATAFPTDPDATGGGSVDGGTGDTYVPPATSEPVPAEPPPATTPPGTGGGVAPPPSGGDAGGGTGGGSSGGSSGGIGPG